MTSFIVNGNIYPDSAPIKEQKEKVSILEAALWYAERDIPVFPCHSITELGNCSCSNPRCDKRGEHPATQNGFYDATTDLEQIRTWWMQMPHANIAMPTGKISGYCVADVNLQNGGPIDRFEFQQAFGPLPPETVEVITGGGGKHYYFLHDVRELAGIKLPKNLGTGVELKDDGSYIILPPSLHLSGRRYEFDGIDGRNGLTRCASFPAWLIERIKEVSRREAGQLMEKEKWPKNTRNQRLTNLAGSLRKNSVGEKAITASLLAANQEHCEPPLDKEEVCKIAESVSRYAPDQIAPASDTLEEMASQLGAKPSASHVSVQLNAPPSGKRCPKTANADQLFTGKYEEVVGMIDKVLFPGITLLQSAPKVGKTYWAQQASLNLIDGTPFMNRFPITKKHRVLYVDIEGTEARAHQRLKQLGELTENTRNLHFMFRPFESWPNNLQQIEQKIVEEEIDLVILDTFLALLTGPGKGGRDIVRNDYDNISRIRDMCTRHDASAIIVSHAKKNTEGMSATDSGIHSTGTSASVDSLITLKRLPSGSVKMDVLPRDGEPGEYEIQLDPQNHQGWYIIGTGNDVGQSKERQAILSVFHKQQRPLKPKDVAIALEKNRNTTQALIQNLAYSGALESLGNGSYRLRDYES